MLERPHPQSAGTTNSLGYHRGTCDWVTYSVLQESDDVVITSKKEGKGVLRRLHYCNSFVNTYKGENLNANRSRTCWPTRFAAEPWWNEFTISNTSKIIIHLSPWTSNTSLYSPSSKPSLRPRPSHAKEVQATRAMAWSTHAQVKDCVLSTLPMVIAVYSLCPMVRMDVFRIRMLWPVRVN